jgi:RNA polymerase sigma factor (sigma-70 family)
VKRPPASRTYLDVTSDDDRFAALFEAHYHRILGYALRRTSEADAADAAAETFTVAWRRFDDVPPGDDALLWLYGVARRVLANQARSARRRARLAAAVDAEPQPVAFEPAAPPSDVALAFARLTDDDRELLALVAWEGLDSSAIAKLLCCSRNAVRIRLHRARRRLASELADGGARAGTVAASAPRSSTGGVT